MIPGPFDYHRPTSLDEAISLLQQHGGDAKILAGGQSLIPALRFRLAVPSVLIDINGELFPRAEAKVSVFDSGFMLGDGMWEGIRLYNGTWAFFDEHMDRLFEACKAVSPPITGTCDACSRTVRTPDDTDRPAPTPRQWRAGRLRGLSRRQPLKNNLGC